MNRAAPELGQWLTRASRQWPWLALIGALVLGVAALWLRALSSSSFAGSPGGAEPAPLGNAGAASSAPPPAAAGAGGAGVAQAPEQAPPVEAEPPPNVRIVFRTVPSRVRASVSWGGKRLGFVERNRPLVVTRPRDSGPLDVIIRSEGFIPVHTRAYTFDDSVLEVKLTPLDKIDTVYGYKQPLPPPPDAGVPPPSEIILP